VGRTGTHSLKDALEILLGGTCHHMIELLGHPEEIPGWIDAIDGRPVDWNQLLGRYTAMVDWPGGAFWREISAANPDALILLSVRDPEGWYKSASDTIFFGMDQTDHDLGPWMSKVKQLLGERFCNDFVDKDAMIAAFNRHNDAVRAEAPADRLLEWVPADGWAPICERLGVAVPDQPFPVTNTTKEFREMLGMPPLEA
jgi:hypothetical protein